jgi:hypothetical protein
MGLFDIFDSESGIHVSEHTGHHDVDHFFDSIGHSIKDIAPAAITLGIIGYGLKIITDGLSGKKHR